MPSRSDHLIQSQYNEQIAPSLISSAPDWAVTIYFYAALHWVKAYFAKRGYSKLKTHSDIFDALRKDHQVSPITINKYWKLYKMSKQARYDCLPATSFNVSDSQQLLSEIKRNIQP